MTGESRRPVPHGAAHDLTQGPITRTLVMFSLPTLGSNIIHSLNGSINAVWVGRLLGETALTATANASLLLFFLLSGVFGFGMAATILVGHGFGRQDYVMARRAVGSASGLFAVIGTLIAALGWWYAPDLLRAMQTPPAALDMAIDYLRIIFLSLPALYFLIFLTMALRGAGDARTPFLFIGLSAVIDVGLNPLLILGLGPFPAMGIVGSGWAMLTAQMVSLVGMLIYIYAKDLPLRLRGAEFRYLLPDVAMLKAILLKGIPMGMQMAVISVSALVMITFVNAYGVTTAAAYGVVAQLWNYIQMPAMAIGAAVSAMAAQNVGAGLWHRVGRITVSAAMINVAMTGLMVVLMILFSRPIAELFLKGDSAAVDIVRHINLVAGWGFVMFGVTLVIFGTVRATGAVYGPLIVLFVAMVPVRLGFVYAFEGTMGAEAIWWSFPIGSIAATVLAYGYYRAGRWRKASMLDDKPDPSECEDQALLPAESAGQPPQPI